MRSIKYHHFICLYGFNFKEVFDNAISLPSMCFDFDCFLKLILLIGLQKWSVRHVPIQFRGSLCVLKIYIVWSFEME